MLCAASISWSNYLSFFIYPFFSGVIPKICKTAHVLPLHKGDDKADINNFRPISKLPYPAKVLESLVNNQLKSFPSIYPVLSPHQSGFRDKHSPVTATTLVTNDMISTADKGKYCAALFVDLTKHFDTVDHALPIQRLSDWLVLIVIPVIDSRMTCLINNNVWL